MEESNLLCQGQYQVRSMHARSRDRTRAGTPRADPEGRRGYAAGYDNAKGMVGMDL